MNKYKYFKLNYKENYKENFQSSCNNFFKGKTFCQLNKNNNKCECKYQKDGIEYEETLENEEFSVMNEIVFDHIEESD